MGALGVEHRLRLLHFVESTDTSGYFPRLARFADRTRFDVTIATLKPADPALEAALRDDGVSHFSLDCRGRAAYPGAILRLRQRLAGVDVVHTHLFEPSVVGLLAAALAGTRVRVITRHYSDYHTRIHKHAHVALDRMTTTLSHAVVAVSQHTARHLKEVEHADPAKVHTIEYGVDFGRLRLSPSETRARLRGELVGNARLLLLTPGRLHPEKGYEYLFAALARVPQAILQSLRVVVAGDGPFRDRYEDQIRSLGLTGIVRLLGFRRDIADLMAVADAVVLPSLAESFGFVFAEALYLGTPVVSTQVGGIPEIVRHGVDGLLVPPAEVDALATALERIATEPQLLARLQGAGCERVARRFSFPGMMRAYESLYEELFAARS